MTPATRLTPAYDNKIYQKYSKKTIQNKEKNKVAFLQDIDLPVAKKVPLLCVTYPLTDKNQVTLLQEIMGGILEQPVELAILGIGNEKFQKTFTDLAAAHPSKVVIIENNEVNQRKLYAAADMLLASSDSPECLEEIKNAMVYGAVPVMPPAPFAIDYDPVREQGNAFFYPPKSPWSFFAALIRALENFRFPYDWRNIEVNAME